MHLKKDDGVSNVVGELMLIAVSLVLVAVFAASFFGVLPGERAEVIEFDQGICDQSDPDRLAFQFTYKWGDYLSSSDLQVLVYDGDSSDPLSSVEYYVTDGVNRASALDFGTSVVIWIPKPALSTHTYTFVLSGPRGILETKTKQVVIV